MAKRAIALAEYLPTMGVEMDSGFLREGIVLMVRLLTVADVSKQCPYRYVGQVANARALGLKPPRPSLESEFGSQAWFNDGATDAGVHLDQDTPSPDYAA